MVTQFVAYYNHERLHSAIGFIAPADMLAGRADAIWAARDQKLEAARARRQALRKEQLDETASQKSRRTHDRHLAHTQPLTKITAVLH